MPGVFNCDVLAELQPALTESCRRRFFCLFQLPPVPLVFLRTGSYHAATLDVSKSTDPLDSVVHPNISHDDLTGPSSSLVTCNSTPKVGAKAVQIGPSVFLHQA